MKIPRKIRTYCPHCKKHTTHEIVEARKRKTRKMSEGQRKFEKILKGYGGFPRAKPKGGKPTKRVNLLYKCSGCGKAHTKKGFRTKRLEFQE